MADGGLSLLPQCAQAATAAGIASSGCGTDVVCLCTSNSFSLALQGVVATRCSPSDGQKTLDFAKQLCTAAIPSLNDSRASTIVTSIVIVSVLALAAVIARFVARRMAKVALWWDDYLIIVALVLTFGLNFNNAYAVHFGSGRHVVTLTLSQISIFAKITFATQVLYGLAITPVKLSILCLYHRIFPSRSFRNASVAAGLLSVVWTIVQVFTTIFGCKPVEYSWDKSIPNGSCLSLYARGYGFTAANFVTDLVVWLLPIPWLWGLQMTPSRKMAVVGMFLLGGLVCISVIVRLPLILKLNEADITWTIVDAAIWLNVECNIGIVCACLPIMRPLFRAASQRLSSRNRSSKYTRTDSRGRTGDSGLRTSSSEHIVGDKADDMGREPAEVSIAMPELPRREPPWKV